MSVLRTLTLLLTALALVSPALAQEAAEDDADPGDVPAVASAGPGGLPIPEASSAVAGLGVMSCQSVNQRYSANFRYYQSLGMDAETAYWTSFQGMLHWALGYMSHRNRALDQAGAEPVNLQPIRLDHARQLDFLRDWCLGNPTLTFNDAVEALFAELAFPR
ncbi:MAG: hypothetical protein ACFCVH_22705 [Alphaproteobacteria bacterium]